MSVVYNKAKRAISSLSEVFNKQKNNPLRIYDKNNEEIPIDDPDPPTGLLELTQNADINNQLISAALAIGDVKLATGVYPITPEIDINGRTLDLNGSTLKSSVTPFYNGAWFTMLGESPCIKNGKLVGNYAHAPGEPGYVPLETDGNGIETAVGIPQGKFTNCLIKDVEFDNICGYIICPRNGTNEGRSASPEMAPESGWSTFMFQTNYPYITARHGIGYGYEISTARVDYRFYNASHILISEETGIPGEAIEKPQNAVSVDVKTYGAYVRYVLREYMFDNSLVIDGCTFKCNQRLGIANLPGISTVRNCVSISNGFPREDHTGISWDSSTSGFMDIEDVQTPILEVIGCSSTNENLGIATRAYSMTVEDSSLYVRVYGGWDVVVRRNTGPVVCNTVSVQTNVDIYDSDLLHMDSISTTPIGPNMRIHNCTVNIGNALNYLPGFKSIVDTQIIGVAATLNRVVIGEITGTYDCNLQLATMDGSNLTLMLPSTGRRGVRFAFGDCYGISTNALILPNSHTITDCDFIIEDERWCDIASTSLVAAAFSGEYVNCSFKITEDVPFKAIAAWMDDPIDISFNGCDFNIDDGLYLYTNIKSGSVIEYTRCTINGSAMTQADAERVTKYDITGITIIVS